MTLHEWLLFMAIWTAASIPLGPNAINCIAVAAANGFVRALWSVLGVMIAALIHMTLAITGVAAFLNAHPVAYEALRWLGVGYLAWMGLKLLSRGGGQIDGAPSAPGGLSKPLVRRAVVISLSNPKAIFAWMAVFSQFVDPARPLGTQLTVLAPSALAVTAAVYVGYCAAGHAMSRLSVGVGRRWIDRGAGASYLLFAAGLAGGDLRRS